MKRIVRQRYAEKAIPAVVLFAFLFMTVGIHVIHPFVHAHYHHNEGSHCRAGGGKTVDSNSCPMPELQNQETPRNHKCPICEYLANFVIARLKVTEPLVTLINNENWAAYPIDTILPQQSSISAISPRGPPFVS